MNVIAWVMLGGLLGWLSSLLMRPEGQRGAALDVIVGMAGAYCGGALLAPWLGLAPVTEQELGVLALGVAALGAVLLLGLSNALVRRRLLR